SDRTFIWLAVACYAVRGALLLRRDAGRLNYITMLAGFVFQTGFLYWRGQNIHRCPLTNSFEFTVFLIWAAVLFYLLIGPAYQVSFLGAFTAPLAVALGLIALLGLDDTPRTL